MSALDKLFRDLESKKRGPEVSHSANRDTFAATLTPPQEDAAKPRPKKHKPLDSSKPWLSWTDEQLKAEILVMEKKTADMKRMADQAVKEYNLEKNLQEAFTESMDKYTPDVVAKLDSAAEIVGDLFEGFCFQRSSRARTSTRRTD
jgi:hypothetical protein